jgi:hypothetical protein
LASSMSWAVPQRSSMMRLRSAALRSCSFFSSSAAFLRSSNCTGSARARSVRPESRKNEPSHPEFLLSLRCHETLLGLLSLGRFLHALAHFGALGLDLSLLLLLLLEAQGHTQCAVRSTQLAASLASANSQVAKTMGAFCPLFVFIANRNLREKF